MKDSGGLTEFVRAGRRTHCVSACRPKLMLLLPPLLLLLMLLKELLLKVLQPL